MSPGHQSPPPPLAANDFVLLYRSFDSIIQIPALTPGGITNCRHGAFHHDDIIGKLTWGETIEPRTSQEKFKRGMILVRPTPALITDTVRHRTQIIYHGDISMILTGLDVRPGKKVVEAGTGSGSLSTSLIQALRHHGSDRSLDGHLYTFEYHEPRFVEAKSDFERYGFSDIVTIQHRDVIHDGLPDELVDMDAVFWDLPAPWKCIITAKEHLREGGLLCTFSPCIEQVMKNCAAMEAEGFTGIHTYECMLKEWGVMSTAKLNRTRKRGRDDRAKPNAVSGNADEQLSWIRVYGTVSLQLPMYTSVRIWNVFRHASPSNVVQFHENPFDLPFSVQADHLLDLEDVMAIYRDNYEGTQFDLTKGILAGPFHSPYRLEGGEGEVEVPGQFARGISIPRTAYTMIGYPDPDNAVLYYSEDAPATSLFVPFLCKTLSEAGGMKLAEAANLYAKQFQVGYKGDFSNAKETAWWAFDFVANWMAVNYDNMSREFVKPAIKYWQPRLLEAALSKSTATCKAIQESVVQYWWKLSDTLVVRYNDGFYNFPPSDPAAVEHIGYPADFLAMIGYSNYFYTPQYVQPATSSITAEEVVTRHSTIQVFLILLVGAFVGFVTGFNLEKIRRRRLSTPNHATATPPTRSGYARLFDPLL
ncbi:hypothetical protein FOZ62_023574 [Perkinsus olseni]|uniref:tRNA (adenine(58)-N(1))-methyltransferase n=1 Tax=Perkinsus olseni TaxID=32597 RepID=A0A7J6P141_PEROL|nr:hypothetical protein FOZ62_023574 [Perkinsus olseni]